MVSDSKLVRIPLVLHAQLIKMLEDLEEETGLRITLTSYVALAIRDKIQKERALLFEQAFDKKAKCSE